MASGAQPCLRKHPGSAGRAEPCLLLKGCAHHAFQHDGVVGRIHHPFAASLALVEVASPLRLPGQQQFLLGCIGVIGLCGGKSCTGHTTAEVVPVPCSLRGFLILSGIFFAHPAIYPPSVILKRIAKSVTINSNSGWPLLFVGAVGGTPSSLERCNVPRHQIRSSRLPAPDFMCLHPLLYGLSRFCPPQKPSN